MISSSWIRVLTFLLAWGAIWFPVAWLVSFSIKWQPGEELSIKQKLYLLASLYILVPVVIGWKFRAEYLSWSDLGLSLIPSSQWYLLLGLGLGILSLAATFYLELILGLIHWSWPDFDSAWPKFLLVLCLSLVISLVEETVFRGYIFSTLLKDNSWLVASAISSLVFAILHLVWERKQTFPQVPGLWLMGMVLTGARYFGGDSVYLALGLHAGWVWSLTCIDSFEVVSYKFDHHWFTGLNRQPLAGLAGVFCLSLACLMMVAVFSF